MTPSECKEVSPQCPEGQEDGYRLGWYQGQVSAYDDFHGTPCEQIRHRQNMEDVLKALEPFALSLVIARGRLGKFPDRCDVEAIAKRYVTHEDFATALEKLDEYKTEVPSATASA